MPLSIAVSHSTPPAPADATFVEVLAKRLANGLVVAAAVAAIVSAPAVGVSGGTVIQVQAAPWTVFVQQVAGSARFLCTGSVVDPSHVLTAAHCLFDEAGTQAQPTQLSIRAGVSNFTAPLSTDLYSSLSLVIRATVFGQSDTGEMFKANPISYTLNLRHSCGNGRVDDGELCDPNGLETCRGFCVIPQGQTNGSCSNDKNRLCQFDADCQGVCTPPNIPQECVCAY